MKLLIISISIALFVIILCLNVYYSAKARVGILETIRPGRIVISMTTSPKRITEIYRVIESMENQTIKPDLYFINLPRVFKRDNSRFSDIPAFLINDKIILNSCEDLGPATKIVPTCKDKRIKETDIIFSVDDDIHYPPELLELYLRSHINYPDFVISGTSLFPKKNAERYGELVECDLLEGFSCVLYKKAWLCDIPSDIFDKRRVPIYHYLSDDLVLSNYLIMKGIRIMHFTIQNPVIRKIKPLTYGLQADALHNGAGGLAPTCAEGELCNSTNYIETVKFLRKHKSYYLTYMEDDIKRV